MNAIRRLIKQDWFPYLALLVFYLAASGVAPAVELLNGAAR